MPSTVTVAAISTFTPIYDPLVYSVTSTESGSVTIADGPSSGCDHCYFIAEVANIVVGASLVSGEATKLQLSIGTTSFTFGGNLTITPTPTPFTIYDFPDTYVLSGETIISPTAYYVFSAYSSTLLYSEDYSCTTSRGIRVLFGPLAVSIPSATDQVRFASVAERALVDYFGAPACVRPVVEVIVTEVGGPSQPAATTSTSDIGLLSPLALAPPARSTVAASTSSSSSSSNASETTSSSTQVQTIPTNPPSSTSQIATTTPLQTGAKIGIGVGVPLSVIAFFIAASCLRFRTRRKPSKPQSSNRQIRRRRSGWRAYFQHKEELDAEEQRRHEVENTDARREMEAVERHELEVAEHAQELIGAEHAQELES